MKAKAAEKAFRDMVKRHNYKWHKYGDVRYCIHCKKALPKSEHAPDFSLWEVYNWVECKNSDKTGRWNASELMVGGTRENQRVFLLENNGWLFILLGTGRAPKGKSAYFIPFKEWVDKIEPILDVNKMRSIRKSCKGKRPGADLLLQSYRLEWEDGGWNIPKGHLFWSELFRNLCKVLADVYPLIGKE
ncbi:MAG: hypothetical protein ACXABN_18200 [Candidatus Thorarchaeota archaeon]|jgi:hypothetical protein